MLPSALPPQFPSDRCPSHDDRYLLSEPLLRYRLPWHQTETGAVVEHRKAPAGELHVAAIGAAHALAVGNGAMREAGFRGYGFGGAVDLASTQGRQQIACQDHALSAPLGQPLFNQEIRSLPQRFAHVTAETVVGNTAGAGDQLLVQPGRADHARLPLN